MTSDPLQSFLGIDFYNHDTKHTDPLAGYECDIETTI
jgi:hypothetical protein